MLYTIAVILLVAWLLGFVGIYTIGSFIHVLLVVAIVLFLVGLISGRPSWDSHIESRRPTVRAGHLTGSVPNGTPGGVWVLVRR
jgi:uncharacterized membrane protein YtjA (UPF0391 family)